MNVSMHWAGCLLKGIYTLGSLHSEWDLSIGQSALESMHALGSLHFEWMHAMARFAVCLLNTSGKQAVSILMSCAVTTGSLSSSLLVCWTQCISNLHYHGTGPFPAEFFPQC